MSGTFNTNSSAHTDIVILLDASGSMDDFGSEAVDGVNRLIQEQAELGGTANVTIWRFSYRDKIVEIMREARVTKELALAAEDYKPVGGTAFNQAMGFVIDATGKRYSERRPGDPVPTKRIFAVMTDGKENASKGEWAGAAGAAKVRAMIEHQTQVYKWEFMFLAANMDAQGAGKAYGFSAANIQQFATQHGEVSRGVGGLSSMITRSRCGVAPLNPEPPPSRNLAPGLPPELEITMPPAMTARTPDSLDEVLGAYTSEDPDDTLGLGSIGVRRPVRSGQHM